MTIISTTTKVSTADDASPAGGSAARLAVIYGSIREGRFGPVVGDWFVREAEAHDGFDEVDVIDLAEHPLPLGFQQLDEKAVVEADQVRRELSERLAAADAFVVVTPEYNHSFPASLKNAIDYFHAEWQAKPVGFVAYGGVSGGLRAVEQLRQVYAELHAVTVRDALGFQDAGSIFGTDGRPRDQEGSSAAARGMLAQLDWWATALRAARMRNPYAAALT